MSLAKAELMNSQRIQNALQLLRDENTADEGLRTLQQLRCVSPEVLTALRQRAETGNVRLRMRALLTFHELSPEDPFPREVLLREIRTNRDPFELEEILPYIGYFGSQAVCDFIGESHELLHDPEEWVRYWTINTIRNLKPGPDLHPAVPDLIDCLSDSSDRIREEAALALGPIGPEAASALDALIAAGTDPVPAVREEAYRALERCGPIARPALPVLVEQLGKEQEVPLFYIAFAIEAIGLEDERFFPQLIEAMGCGDQTVIDHLWSAMTKIRSDWGTET
jgi:hypothetical protein